MVLGLVLIVCEERQYDVAGGFYDQITRLYVEGAGGLLGVGRG